MDKRWIGQISLRLDIEKSHGMMQTNSADKIFFIRKCSDLSYVGLPAGINILSRWEDHFVSDDRSWFKNPVKMTKILITQISMALIFFMPGLWRISEECRFMWLFNGTFIDVRTIRNDWMAIHWASWDTGSPSPIVASFPLSGIMQSKSPLDSLLKVVSITCDHTVAPCSPVMKKVQ
jgi:hypothetical protein